jgi:hypothetical protein
MRRLHGPVATLADLDTALALMALESRYIAGHARQQ